MKKITLLVSITFCVLFNVNTNAKNTSENNTIQRVRVDFTSPDGYVRHLLLGFTTNDAATDNFDFGYDAINIEDFPNDMNWMIEDERYIVQGVGAYATTKFYPLGIFLSDSGEIQIGLNSLENFDEEIPVYVYDSELNTYAQINEQNFMHDISSGEYINRFYITFSTDLTIESNSALSMDNENLIKNEIKFYSNFNELHVISSDNILSIKMFDNSGKQINSFSFETTNEIKLPIEGTNLSTGIYIVSVTTLSGVQNKLIHL